MISVNMLMICWFRIKGNSILRRARLHDSGLQMFFNRQGHLVRTISRESECFGIAVPVCAFTPAGNQVVVEISGVLDLNEVVD